MGRVERRRELLSRMPKGGECCEIGVWDGGFSEEILELTQPKKLHLVDPWSYQPEFGNAAFGRDDGSNKMEEKYKAVKEKFKGNKKVKIHRKMSDEALETFKDGSLDWVYIDGNHNYEVVRNDLRLAAQKVKPNGVIAGDDLLWNVRKGAPVRTAVRELRAELGETHNFFRIGQQYIFELSRG